MSSAKVPQRSRTAALLARAGLVVVSLALVVVSFEIAIRARSEWSLGEARSKRPPIEQRALIPSSDPSLRVEFNPGYSNGDFTVNEFGMADGPIGVEPAPGVTRIAIFGDSITANWRLVPRQQAFPALLEAELNRRAELRGSKQRFETLNFAVNSYSILESLRMAELQVPRFEPDLVIVQLCLNDPFPSPAGYEPMTTAYGLRAVDFVVRNLFWERFWAQAFVGVHYDEQGWENWSRGIAGFGSIAAKTPTLAVLFPYLEPRAYAEWGFAELHEGIAERAERAAIPLVDLLGGPIDRLTEADPVHPGPAGHRYAAERILGHLLESHSIEFP